MRDGCDFRPVSGAGIRVLGGAQVPEVGRCACRAARAGRSGAGDQSWVKRMTTWGLAIGGDRREEARFFETKEGPAAHAPGCNERRSQNATVAVVTYWRGSV